MRSITVLLTSCLTGLDLSVLQIKTKIVTIIQADSKPVIQEVNGTVIHPPLVFPGFLKFIQLAYMGLQGTFTSRSPIACDVDYLH